MNDIGWATVLREVADSHPELKDGLHGAADHFERMETEIANLQAEVDAWRDRFKGAGFDGKRIVMCG